MHRHGRKDRHHVHVEQAGLTRVVLVGNPNSGKSVFFNALTGLYVDVSNFPGTTVELAQARVGDNLFIDTPGVYGISAFNDEERVTRDVVLTADVIVNVINAAHLERDLFLTLQCIDMGIPMVVAVNMLDEAVGSGLKIDLELLSHLLGVSVVGTVAIKKQGFQELEESLKNPKVGIIGDYLAEDLSRLLDRLGTKGEVMLYLEDDIDVATRHGLEIPGSREEIYLARRERVNDIVHHVVSEETKGARFSTILGRLMLKPITGIPMLLATLWAMYYVIGVFIAQTVVEITEEVVMQGMYEPAVQGFVTRFVSEDSIIGSILVGEFGVLTMTVTYVFGLLLPLVIGFYLLLSLLEDSG